MLEPRQWAQMEFSSANLGDGRRTRRLVDVATRMAQTQSGTMPRALPDSAELKGAYRFYDTKEVTHKRIVAPHCEQTRARCSQPGDYLLIEDTTALDFKHRKAKGLGPIADGEGSQGMLLHSTLALRVEGWDLEQEPEVTVQGLIDQHCWVRPKKKRSAKTRPEILRRQRESQRWAKSLTEFRAPEGVQWTYIADRESDIYEVFGRCNEAGVDFIIRAAQRRCLEGEEQTIFGALETAPVLGRFELKFRRRGDTPARTAVLEVRSVKVTVRGPWRPGGMTAPFELNVVLVREIGNNTKERIEWVLLTSLPCKRFVEVRRIVACYAKRWTVEEYHKALKTGAQIECSQLETAHRLQALLGILALVALRLTSTKFLARATPDLPVDEESFGREQLAVLSAKLGRPTGGWTDGALIVATARLGGFLARRGDGAPGWITIWRGWSKLQIMVEGIEAIQNQKCG